MNKKLEMSPLQQHNHKNVVSIAFVINVIKWLMWTVETVYLAELMRNLFRSGAKHLSTLLTKAALTQCWSKAGPPSATLAQHQTSTGLTPRVCWAAFNPVKNKTFVQFWTNVEDVVPTLYKCYTNVFVFAGNSSCPANTIY